MSPRPSAASVTVRALAIAPETFPVVAFRSRCEFRSRSACRFAIVPRFTIGPPIDVALRVALAVGVAVLIGGRVPFVGSPAVADEPNRAESDGRPDKLRELQTEAMTKTRAAWGHWGTDPAKYSTWTNHSNRLIPVYTFGVTLDRWRAEGSAYADPDRLAAIYGEVPEGSLNPSATYHDQTDLYRLQQDLIDAGYRRVILFVLDGMDWQTTRAAATYQNAAVSYDRGRGTGLSFLDYRGAPTDFGLVVTSPRRAKVRGDVDTQLVLDGDRDPTGGYDPARGGHEPWTEPPRNEYLLGMDRGRPHTVADSAATATSMTNGVKTYNGSINVAVDGQQLEPIARRLQRERGFRVGVVTSVPVSHATPAAAYANNVTRNDYQDITRDLVGLPSAAHRDAPLPGVDVLIGCGWGETARSASAQGTNFLPGNKYFHEDDLRRVDARHGGDFVVATRTPGRNGAKVLADATRQAVRQGRRLLGFFGTDGGHLPYQTADGGYDPTIDVKGKEDYDAADVDENPTLAEMTEAALAALEPSEEGFWLLIEAGDVDWANHANNLDSSIGAVLSGEAAFDTVTDWVENQPSGWDHTAVIVTADHGHYLEITDMEAIAEAGK